jgi:putative membrane protein
MRRAITSLLSMLVVLGASSCVVPPYADVTDCADFVETPTEYHTEFAGRAGMVTQQEHSFVCYATVLGRAQVTSAMMAQHRGASPAVTRFAAITVEEQEMLDRRLADIAEQHDGVIPPYGLDAPHLAMLDQLSTLSGDAFDRAYLEYQLQDAQATIAVLQQEVVAGSEPTLRGFARAALPHVEERAREAQSIIEQLPG